MISTQDPFHPISSKSVCSSSLIKISFSSGLPLAFAGGFLLQLPDYVPWLFLSHAAIIIAMRENIKLSVFIFSFPNGELTR
ncbi:hypothetical protein [Fervidicoccus fontis]|uniref:Uncharacterized protein n=1 Tax=Fervidicoccus fontis TaxID=683846 RepID=A0A7C2VMV3_9CREN|nr:hypothetical protein [Fervidicoccus fontis]HEW63834.1 hypothetical protein [Fervidicoccus fontis]